jgi:hypothetical protein
MYKNGRLYFSWEEPLPLEVPGMPELRFFPERITLSCHSDSLDDGCLKKAVYVPDISSLRENEERGGYEMWYLNISDPNGEVLFWACLTGEWMEAKKFFRGQPVAEVDGGERWDGFFERVSQLPIPPEERCIIIRQPIEKIVY